MTRWITSDMRQAKQLPDLRYAVPYAGRSMTPPVHLIVSTMLAMLREYGYAWRWLDEADIISRCLHGTVAELGLSRESLRSTIDSMVEDELLERPSVGDPRLLLLTSSSMARTRV